MKPRVAIVGTGVAGMAAGYFLRDLCEVSFFEKDSRPGGHTHTVTVDENSKPVHVDTGFMVYNDVTYPNLIRFFEELKIPTKDTSMSFGVQHIPSGLEFCGTGISGLFAQRRNIFNLSFWKLLGEIDRFNKICVKVLEEENKYASWTLEKYLNENKFSPELSEKYLVPMSSAIWSTPPSQMADFPVVTLIRFFKNHGLLGLSTHYTWKTVDGGSRVYRDKVLGMFEGRVHLSKPVTGINRSGKEVTLLYKGSEPMIFDKVILASHADEALVILDPEATSQETTVLSKFKYQENQAMLHTDESLMPKSREVWSSWNYRVEKDGSPTTIYWMNHLQGVSKNKNYFVSINDSGKVSEDKVLWRGVYTHPLYTVDSVLAQKDLPRLNENGKVFFAGSYFKYGFHEDAFTSGKNAAEALMRFIS